MADERHDVQYRIYFLGEKMKEYFRKSECFSVLSIDKHAKHVKATDLTPGQIENQRGDVACIYQGENYISFSPIFALGLDIAENYSKVMINPENFLHLSFTDTAAEGVGWDVDTISKWKDWITDMLSGDDAEAENFQRFILNNRTFTEKTLAGISSPLPPRPKMSFFDSDYRVTISAGDETTETPPSLLTVYLSVGTPEKCAKTKVGGRQWAYLIFPNGSFWGPAVMYVDVGTDRKLFRRMILPKQEDRIDMLAQAIVDGYDSVLKRVTEQMMSGFEYALNCFKLWLEDAAENNVNGD